MRVRRYHHHGNDFPHANFEPDEVELLVSAVQTSLAHLRQANEREGGNDTELIEYGRRYAGLLQKIEAVASS